MPQRPPTDLVIVSFASERAAERSLRVNWHVKQYPHLSLPSACVIRRHHDGGISYVSLRDVTPLSVDWYGGLAGFAVACLLLVPLLLAGQDEVHAAPFAGSVDPRVRDALRDALPPDSSAVVFLVGHDEVEQAMVDAGTLGGDVLHFAVDDVTAAGLAGAIERELSV